MNATPVQPNALDLAAHMAQKAQPKPEDAEQVVVRTYRLPAAAPLPHSMPVLGGEIDASGDKFAMSFNPQAAELYLLVESRDHRILGLPDLLETWLTASGAVPNQPERPRILRELDAAIVGIDVARTLAEQDTDHTLAFDHANAAVTCIESALRLARSLRSNIEQRVADTASGIDA